MPPQRALGPQHPAVGSRVEASHRRPTPLCACLYHLVSHPPLCLPLSFFLFLEEATGQGVLSTKEPCYMRKAMTGSWVTWICTLVLPLTCCVTLGKSLSPLWPSISHHPISHTRITQDQEVPST